MRRMALNAPGIEAGKLERAGRNDDLLPGVIRAVASRHDKGEPI